MKYDCVIVGGGMVGATMALGLLKQGRSVALIEKKLPEHPIHSTSAPDLRVSAISIGTVNLLQNLGAWPLLESTRTVSYETIEFWESIDAPVVFKASMLDLPYLGYIVENSLLQLSLLKHLQNYKKFVLYAPVVLQNLSPTSTGWQLFLDNNEYLHALLVIGSDGANSQVRQQAGIGCKISHYMQNCLVVSVKKFKPLSETVWQQFCPSGPRAFLPLFDDWASLVWYDTPARIDQLYKLDRINLAQAIMQAYPQRLDVIQVDTVAAFSLRRQHASHYCVPGLVLIGDAAHTIHPLAGQGVNLGFRDVSALLNILKQTWPTGDQKYSFSSLQQYQRQRKYDNLLMQYSMDLFYRGFSTSVPPIPLLRHFFMLTINQLMVVKRSMLRYILGLSHDLKNQK